MKDTVAIILAGGKGERLYPLTRDRSKPAVYFGGIYRIIDIALSNCVNSEIYTIMVFPQYKAQSLMDHIDEGWNIFNHSLGHYLRIVPPQMRVSSDWYRGTADSVRQNLDLLEHAQAEHFLILSGDHIYKMNYDQFREFHLESDAGISLSAIEVPVEEAGKYGVLTVNEQFRVTGFEEKPAKPSEIPGRPGFSLVSMGIYLFNRELLLTSLREVPGDDFGQHLIPWLIQREKVYAYPYTAKNKIRDYLVKSYPDGRRERVLDPHTPDSGYWRDVGDIDAYWSANMDLTGVAPAFNLYSTLWPLRTAFKSYPPAKTIFQNSSENRVGQVFDSLLAPGTIISGGKVSHSVLHYDVRVNSWAEVSESVIFPHVDVGRYCKIRRTIIDRDNHIPPGTVIGYHPEEDRKRFAISEKGIVVVGRKTFR
ncbi:MAG: glucose-1-phosphate adenylyltransferase [Bacteroidetes bacterium]|nr:glucose-1-phosphate adenylyltransferase [Bacteroidota bacterium]